MQTDVIWRPSEPSIASGSLAPQGSHSSAGSRGSRSGDRCRARKMPVMWLSSFKAPEHWLGYIIQYFIHFLYMNMYRIISNHIHMFHIISYIHNTSIHTLIKVMIFFAFKVWHSRERRPTRWPRLPQALMLQAVALV